jgi:phosphate transport system permease protein
MSQATPAISPGGNAASILSGEAGASGTLSPRTAYGLVIGSAVAVAFGLIALGAFSLVAFVVLTGIIASLLTYGVALRVEGRRQAFSRLATLSIAFAFALALLPLLSLLYEVFSRGLHRFDVAFFTESARGVVGEGGGASHAIVGTLVITGIAALISVPIGLMAAIYLNEYGGTSRLRKALTFFVDVMTGIPSIVAGLFAYALFELFFGPGIRLGIMGSVALSVLMIPIVIRSAEEILKIVPNHLREAAYALGTPKWKTIVKIVLPTALAGLVTGVMIAVARIIGETAPLLVTTGVVDSVNANPFEGRMQNLAVYAFNEYKNPGVAKEAAYDRAWAAALTLILIVMILNLVARWVYRRYGVKTR